MTKTDALIGLLICAVIGGIAYVVISCPAILCVLAALCAGVFITDAR